MSQIYGKDGIEVESIVEGHTYNVYLQPTEDQVGLPQTIIIQFQNGTTKEVGRNGLTNEVLLAILIDRTNVLNGRFHSEHNDKAIEHMKEALKAFEDRTKSREARGVEGTYVE